MEQFYDYTIAEEVLGVFGAALLAIYAIAAVWGIVAYVLQSLGCYTIAKRRQIRNPWMAWIPVCDMYLLGCISDQYQQVARLKDTKRRVVLLVLSIIDIVASLLLIIMCVGMITDLFFMLERSGMTDNQILEEMMVTIMGVESASSIVSIFSIVYMVFRCIALYDLFASCNPNNKTMFLVLGIFFGFLIPIFIFACRNRDDGMRRPDYMMYNGWGQPQNTWQPPYQPAQPPQNTWQPPQQPYQPSQNTWQPPQQPYQPPQNTWQPPQQPYQPPQNTWQPPQQPAQPQQPTAEPRKAPETPEEPWQ